LGIQSATPSVTALGILWEMELVMASGTLSEMASGMVSAMVLGNKSVTASGMVSGILLAST
jgi:hypothetical protein